METKLHSWYAAVIIFLMAVSCYGSVSYTDIDPYSDGDLSLGAVDKRWDAYLSEVDAISFTIDSDTLTTSEWAYLVGLNQYLKTTSKVYFSWAILEKLEVDNLLFNGNTISVVTGNIIIAGGKILEGGTGSLLDFPTGDFDTCKVNTLLNVDGVVDIDGPAGSGEADDAPEVENVVGGTGGTGGAPPVGGDGGSITKGTGPGRGAYTSGDGGDWTAFTGDAGQGGDTTSQARGGNYLFTTGDGETPSSGDGGDGGDYTLTSGDGGDGSGAGKTGGTGGNFRFICGSGGAGVGGAAAGENGRVTINGQLVIWQNRISSGTLTITASSDTTDVSGVNTLFVNTTSGDVTLGGLVGGIDGQKLMVVKIVAVNDLILEHEEGIGGNTDDFFMHQLGDEIIDAGGVPLIFNGTTEKWYDVSHAKHV